ncbi:SDR family oxidoreductase [Sphingomonas koreensis]|nr:SDR family oxidoreductase [Sphingomonas koreensis]
MTEADAHTAVTPLKGRRAIVTGGTTGIGRAIAVLLASEGAKVHICGRTAEPLRDALDRIAEVGDGAGTAIDLADPENVARYFTEATEWLGGLDIAVINAAVPADALGETDEKALRYQIATDFTGYLLSAHEALDRFDGKGEIKGDVVLIGSMSAHVLGGGSTIYAGIKAGIAGFAEALRREQGEKGVRVSLIEPGFTGSDFQDAADYPDDKKRKLIADAKMLRAEDIAVAAHFALTQPARTVVQQMTVVPRVRDE